MLPLVPTTIAPLEPPVSTPDSPPPPPPIFSPTIMLLNVALNVAAERFSVPLKVYGLLRVDWPRVSAVGVRVVPRFSAPPAGIVTMPLDSWPPTVSSLVVIVLLVPSERELLKLFVPFPE